MNKSAYTVARKGLSGLAFALSVAAASGQQLPPPSFFPGDGSLVPTNVTIASVVQDAQVFYTTDGSFPTTNGVLYTGPLSLTNTTTLWAKAFKAGWTDSSDVMATYYFRPALVTVQKLVANDDSLRPSVSIAVTPSSAVKCYAVEETVPLPLLVTNINLGGVWLASERVIRWGPFADNQTRSLTYQVTGDDDIYELVSRVSLNGYSTWSDDITTKATLTMTNPVLQVAMPIISPAGTNTTPLAATLTCSTPGAMILYTLDGSVPDTNSSVYSLPVPINNALTVRARAFRTNWLPSEVAWMSYELPIPSVPQRTITDNSSPAPLVSIPVNPTNVAASFAVEETLPIFWTPTNISHSGVWVATNRTIRWGPFQDRIARTLSYRINGADGTNGLNGWVSYDGRSFAVAGMDPVVITNAVLPRLPVPTIVSTNGNSVPTRVTISDAVAGAEIRYTLDGSLPAAVSALYSTPLVFSNVTTLRVRAFAAGWSPSGSVAADFLEPFPASVVTRQVDYDVARDWQETRLIATPALGIRSYAVEEYLPVAVVPVLVSHGGIWDSTNRVVRWGPFQDGVARALTNRVSGEAGTNMLLGLGSFDGRSRITTGADILVLNQPPSQPTATPVVTPAGSTGLPVNVSFSCATAGAEMYYTTDSTAPTTNSVRYTGSFQISQAATLRVRAFANGRLPSDVVTVDFAAAGSPVGVATRTITGNATRNPGGSIAVTPNSLVRSWAVEEFLPPTVAAASISHGGILATNNLSIRWGPFQDNVARVLNYTLTGPDGDYLVSGVASFNGQSYAIGGSTSLQSTGAVALVATPVISPANGTVGPVNVSILCATAGAEIYFTTNTTVPTVGSTRYVGTFSVAPGVTVRARAFKADLLPSETASASFAEASDPSTITRAIAGAPSTFQEIRLDVVPSDSIKSYSVVEAIPVALWPTNISDGGVWHPDMHTIRWGPYQDHATRALVYQVRGVDGQYELGGAGSFNGRSQPIGGDSVVSINFPAPSVLTAVAGDRVVYLHWAGVAGARGYNVHFWPAGGESSIQIRNAGVPGNFFTFAGLTNNTLYYFTVAAYDSEGHEGGLSPLVSAVPALGLGTLGNVWFDRTGYFPTNTGIITVEDPDLNTSSNSVQIATVRVTSDSDAWGISLTLAEIGTNSSRFTSTAAGHDLGFTYGSSDDVGKLIHVGSLDQVHVAYLDLQPIAGVTNSASFGSLQESFPVINGQPLDAFAKTGDTVTFSVAAQGGGLRYQWFFNNSPLSGGTNRSLVLSNVWPANEGLYFVVVSNTVGSVASELASLAVASSTPYGGIWQTVPGRVHLERYDEGGEGLAYHDLDAVNHFNYRTNEGVDLAFNVANGNAIIGWTYASEWVNYSINVQQSDFYSILLWAGSPGAATNHIEIDGTNITGQLIVNTGDWNVFQAQKKENVYLSGGHHVLRLVMESMNPAIGNGQINAIDILKPPHITQQPLPQIIPPGSNATFLVIATGTSLAYQWQFKGTNVLNATNNIFTLTNVQSAHNGGYRVICSNAAGVATSTIANLTVEGPYQAVWQTIPGRIRVENYDWGGEGIAYHDTDISNNGGWYRLGEGVDIGRWNGSYLIGYTVAGEWINYSVDVRQSGNYSIVIWNGSLGVSGAERVEIDGTNVTGSLAVPLSGDWNTFLPVRKDGIYLASGHHILRFFAEANNVGNVSAIDVIGPPQISQLAYSPVDRALSFYWETAAGLKYQVQYATNLAAGGWYSLGPTRTATNLTLSVSDIVSTNSQRFYRVELLSDPP